MPDIGTQAKRSLKTDIRIIVVQGQRLRIAIRPRDGTRTPLLLSPALKVKIELVILLSADVLLISYLLFSLYAVKHLITFMFKVTNSLNSIRAIRKELGQI